MRPDLSVREGLLAVGVPVAKAAWPVNKAPDLPWITFRRIRGGETHADNTNYHNIPRYRVELYFRENDPDLVERFEDAVEGLGTSRLYEDTYVATENCYLISFELSLLPKTTE